MSKLPMIKVKWQMASEHLEETTCDLEQAKGVIFGSWSWAFIVAEGKLIHTYDELVQLAHRKEYQDKELLNVVLLDPAIGGG